MIFEGIFIFHLGQVSIAFRMGARYSVEDKKIESEEAKEEDEILNLKREGELTNTRMARELFSAMNVIKRT